LRRFSGRDPSSAREGRAAGCRPGPPALALLKKKGLVVSFPPIPAGSITGRAFLSWVVAESKRVAPLVSWLVSETR